MKYKALLFGSIGTIIETSDIQRKSFNNAFKESGLNWYWDEIDYKNLLQKSGGAKRIGASIANYFHAKNFKIVIHYNKSQEEVNKLSQELNEKEKGSCKTLQADFSLKDSVSNTIEQFYSLSDRIDVLVNNASSFYPTPIQEASEEQWKNLLDTNATTPLFLIQGFQKGLQESSGSVINISDSLASKGIKNYSGNSVN